MIPARPEPSEAVVPRHLEGERLDVAATEVLGSGYSRSRMARWIRNGRLTVDGAVVCRPGEPVAAGQQLRLDPGQEPVAEHEPLPDPRILHEDEWLAVLDKPAGLPMHGNFPGDPRPSVATFLERRYGPGLPDNQGPERRGVVHRLDADTSGVCVVAFEELAFADLQQQFADRTIRKEYRALVYGRPRFLSDWINKRLERDPKRHDRMRTVNSQGPGTRDAQTYWEVLESFDGFAYLKVVPRTGRTHQIRVHLASIQLPLVGDRLYRARNYGPGMLPEGAPEVSRAMLHAYGLAFEHPGLGREVEHTAEPPGDFSALLALLSERLPAGEDGWR